ncbi:hypothetical protein N8T08_004057 [Aspergillus melleus]|uniref:Uncharacterized protein n=1 Tax=Aspergillus melleus TaxID=138277 RepID=A0ACC3B5K4_9EURO|nr:hypothetical protein N8T08_004057 [Aspergillus melleus]
MSSLTKFIPSTRPPSTNRPPSRSRASYFSTKTTTIVIILVSIVLFMISWFSLPSFSSSGDLNQEHGINHGQLSLDMTSTIQLPDPDAELSDDMLDSNLLDLEPFSEGHDCLCSIPRKGRDTERKKKQWGFSSSVPPSSASASPSASVSTFAASPSGEIWVSNFGPLERLHVKLGGLGGLAVMVGVLATLLYG